METMFGDATGLIFAIVKTYCSFLNYLSSTSLAISLKVNLKVKKKKKNCAVIGKSPNLFVQL